MRRMPAILRRGILLNLLRNLTILQIFPTRALPLLRHSRPDRSSSALLCSLDDLLYFRVALPPFQHLGVDMLL